MAPEHIDVLIVGAGLSGIGAALQLRDRAPTRSFVVMEARDVIGGTWDLFRYPGVRSDSDMFTLGYASRPWRGNQALANGAEIRDYIVQTARERGLTDRIRFHHRVTAAAWSSVDTLWTVTVQTPESAEPVVFTCGFLFLNTGYYRYDEGYSPQFPEIERFTGQVVHPQHWPQDLDYRGRQVIVIGSGATAVTLVPALAEDAARVALLQRTPSYVISLPRQDRTAQRLSRLLPERFSYRLTRWKNVLAADAAYRLSQRAPQLVRHLLRTATLRQLPPGFAVDTHFSPPYDPWDQRLCLVPDGDLFRAISSGKAEIVTDQIQAFTKGGLRLTSGRELAADVIVTATGLNLSPFGGIAITVDGETVDPGNTVAYLGMMLSGVPNFAFTIGYAHASWTLKADLVSEYFCRLLTHMQRRGYRTVTPDAPAFEVRTPLIDLKSGYVLRGLDAMPKQGSVPPWRLHQSYLRDVRLFRRGRLEGKSGLTFASRR